MDEFEIGPRTCLSGVLADGDFHSWFRVINGVEYYFLVGPKFFTVEFSDQPEVGPVHHWHRVRTVCGNCEYREMPAGSGGIGE